MKRLLILSSIGLLFCITACQNANDKLREEVMAVHDEVMPRMGDLYNAKVALQEQLGAADPDSLQRQKITLKIAQIDSASEQMMVWMRAFNTTPEGESENEIRQYLESELGKVTKVKNDILKALENNETSE